MPARKKAPAEKFITKFAPYYTPVVVALAVLLAAVPPLVVSGAAFSEWIYRAFNIFSDLLSMCIGDFCST